MEILNIVLNSEAVNTIIQVVVLALAGYCARKLKTYLNTKTKLKLAKNAVLAVEQTCKEIHGEEKLNEALKRFAILLQGKGIKANPEEMKCLLESVVGEFNDVFFKEQYELEEEEEDEISSEIEVEE